MKKFLCVLIISSFLGSSFNLFAVGPVSFYAFRLIFMLFTLCHIFTSYNSTRKRVSQPFMEKYKFILFILLLLTLTTIIQMPSFSTWINGCIFFVMNIMLIYFVYAYTESKKDLENYIIAYMIGIFATLIISVYEYNTGNHIAAANYLIDYRSYSWQYEVLGRYPTAFLYNPNNIGVVTIIGMSFGTMFLKNRTFKGNVLFVIWSALCIYVAFATGSRGAILFGVIMFVLAVLSRSEQFYNKLLGILAFAGIAYCFYLIFDEFLLEQLERSGLLNGPIGRGEDDEGRIFLMKTALEVAMDSLFLGTGPRTAEAAMKAKVGYSITSVHNFWVEMLVTEGVAGTICFAVFYLKCIKTQIALRQKYYMSTAVFLALIAFIFSGFIPPTIITLHFIWFIFGFAIAAEKLHYCSDLCESLK